MASNFVVSIDGMGIVGRFAEVSGLKGGDITLKRGIVNSQLLNQWLELVRTSSPGARKNIVIQLLGERASVTQQWKVTAAMPTKATGPVLSARGGDVAMEELALSAQGIELM